MYSITSIFSNNGLALWENLEKSCEFGGLNMAAVPHFSWQTAEEYQFAQIRLEIGKISSEISEFKFKTSGIGIFRNNQKIFFLIIVKDRNLLEIHEMIWRRTIQYAIQPNMHYAPENWIPHITLNLNPLTEDQFRCSVDELTSRPLNFEFVVNKLGLIYLTAANSGIDSIYPLRNSGINQ